jgi:hypothetical protein
MGCDVYKADPTGRIMMENRLSFEARLAAGASG